MSRVVRLGAPKPKPRFRVGDIVVEKDNPFGEKMKVDLVEMYRVGHEWREGISFTTEHGYGAGNADLFSLLCHTGPGPKRFKE